MEYLQTTLQYIDAETSACTWPLIDQLFYPMIDSRRLVWRLVSCSSRLTYLRLQTVPLRIK